jgi:hypothetical protein
MKAMSGQGGFRAAAGRVAIAVACALAAAPTAFAASCTVRSDAVRATVVELYTSEGCSSCPPADRWLSGFAGRTSGTARVVPLAFHVDYWDDLGWPDRFASPRNSARQRDRVRQSRGSFVYTPQTLVDGRDSAIWRQAKAPGEFPARAATAPGAELVLRVAAGKDGRVAVDLETKLAQESDSGHAVAYLALYENGLVSHVRAGENSGRELRHDFVVRDWVGPLPIGAGAGTSHVFASSGIALENAGVAAVVESADGARVLQGVSLPLCL